MIPADESALWRELDAVLSEAPTEAADIAGELAAIVREHRGARQTERPLEAADWSR